MSFFYIVLFRLKSVYYFNTEVEKIYILIFYFSEAFSYTIKSILNFLRKKTCGEVCEKCFRGGKISY